MRFGLFLVSILFAGNVFAAPPVVILPEITPKKITVDHSLSTIVKKVEEEAINQVFSTIDTNARITGINIHKEGQGVEAEWKGMLSYITDDVASGPCAMNVIVRVEVEEIQPGRHRVQFIPGTDIPVPGQVVGGLGPEAFLTFTVSKLVVEFGRTICAGDSLLPDADRSDEFEE